MLLHIHVLSFVIGFCDSCKTGLSLSSFFKFMTIGLHLEEEDKNLTFSNFSDF